MFTRGYVERCDQDGRSWATRMFENLYLPSVMMVLSVKMLYFHRENVDMPHRKQKDGDDVRSSRHIGGNCVELAHV